MKKITSVSLLVLLLLMNNCSESFLEVEPQSSLTDAGFYKAESDALASVNGVYDALQKGGSGKEVWHNLGHGISGDTESNNGNFNNLAKSLNYDPSNPNFTNFWNQAYTGIARANTTIDRVSEMDIDADIRDQVVAQAKFLRGLFYFQLARAFGDIPLILREQFASDDFFVTRTPVAEVLDQIKKDFVEAAAGLPVEWDAANVGRATRGAALGMLAKTHLELGEYAEVINVSEEIFAMNKYSLAPNMMDNWNVDKENGPESVFEIQFRDGPNAGGWADANEGHFNNQQFAAAGVGQEHAVVGGWGNYIPATSLDTRFEPGDMRRPWQILAVGETHRNTDFTLEEGRSPTNLIYQKYWHGPWEQQQPGGQYSPLNLPYLRFAEVIINYAEALNEVGRYAEAITQLNRLRIRAGAVDGETFAPRPPSTNKDEILDWIFYERRVEFVNEFSFYFDLKRRDRFKEFREENYGDGEKVLSHYRYFPIPTSEIDKNPKLVQTPGY